MDSNEFAILQVVTQRGMVERGETMPGIMIDPIPGIPSGCFWCGDATDVLLFRRLRDESKKAFGLRMIDTHSPREVSRDYEPCEDCRELMSRGVCFKETHEREGIPNLTGRYWVVTARTVRALTKFQALADQIVAKRTAFISRADARRVGLYDAEAAA